MTSIEQPLSASGGLEPAVPVPVTCLTEDALSAVRVAGVRLAVTVDDSGRFRAVVPVSTLEASHPGQRVSACRRAWPATVFVEPASPQEAEHAAAQRQDEPKAGHRIVVVCQGQLAGVVPVPGLIDRPGVTSKLLEMALMNTGRIITRIRYRRYWNAGSAGDTGSPPH
ncbi:MAG TPA: hypothetical protein VLM11_03615 [Streptosporangiaceae bacterium]|nr:hypothetical protein [Streptosporangiaceae bacterium]